jgi:hypothetical protein
MIGWQMVGEIAMDRPEELTLRRRTRFAEHFAERRKK